MPGAKMAKPKGKATAYTCFVQACRDEHKKKSNAPINFADFSKNCGERWKVMGEKDKKRFVDMAEKDQARYNSEMANFSPGAGKKRKQKKDPNAPKRALSAFFCFCAEFRSEIKARNPQMGIGDVAKELGKRWEACQNRSKYEAQSQKDKERYTREHAAYVKSGASDAFKNGSKVTAGAKKAMPVPQQQQQYDDDDEEEDDDEDDDDE